MKEGISDGDNDKDRLKLLYNIKAGNSERILYLLLKTRPFTVYSASMDFGCATRPSTPFF
jgi:hypothetical protein